MQLVEGGEKALADLEKRKETKLGITAKKSAGGVEFADWYTQVCTVAELISYYDVSGNGKVFSTVK